MFGYYFTTLKMFSEFRHLYVDTETQYIFTYVATRQTCSMGTYREMYIPSNHRHGKRMWEAREVALPTTETFTIDDMYYIMFPM